MICGERVESARGTEFPGPPESLKPPDPPELPGVPVTVTVM